jgi:translation initiation factor IF-3
MDKKKDREFKLQITKKDESKINIELNQQDYSHKIKRIKQCLEKIPQAKTLR